MLLFTAMANIIAPNSFTMPLSMPNKEQPFFELEPMTFKQPGKPDFYPVWVAYYKKLGMEIPGRARPAVIPGGLSRSTKIKIIGGF